MYYIGIMSGTSLDGIDAVLVKDVNDKLVFSDSYTTSFPKDLKQDILELLLTFKVHLLKLGEIDSRLGICYADAVNELLKKSGVEHKEVNVIGCHGQTVFHSPRGSFPFTMQIGDGNKVAGLTGIKTVNDFRRMDMAFGGDGAPLAPAFHFGYLSSDQENRIILNLGGIANITVLSNRRNDVLGFDTGPANCLMDLWIQKCKGLKYDEDGKWASSGKVNKQLLDELLKESYFQFEPPKSTGKELFNIEWLENELSKLNDIKQEDVQATLCDFTAKTVADAVLKYSPETEAVYSCGGGAFNKYFQQRLGYYLKEVKISVTDELGIPVQWVEAIAFAWLAKQRVESKPGNIPSVTGASEKVLLGAVYEC
ncbi:MAG TPA: anhydro-N-acetylmuramic acid kinase [Victivallales bacterium]|nr:anhydro-N-acetylmuramic acid kinase [Victivallales bacterium]